MTVVKRAAPSWGPSGDPPHWQGWSGGAAGCCPSEMPIRAGTGTQAMRKTALRVPWKTHLDGRLLLSQLFRAKLAPSAGNTPAAVPKTKVTARFSPAPLSPVLGPRYPGTSGCGHIRGAAPRFLGWSAQPRGSSANTFFARRQTASCIRGAAQHQDRKMSPFLLEMFSGVRFCPSRVNYGALGTFERWRE